MKKILIAGLLLSAIMIVPSVRDVPFGLFSVIFHAIMFASLSSPFLIIYFVFRKNISKTTPVTLGVFFLLFHSYLIYTTYTLPVQEFGYLGLVFVPIYEAVVAIPAALLVAFIIKRSRTGTPQ